MNRITYKIICLAIILCYILSCKKEINFEDDSVDKILVINSLFTDDSLIKVQVSHISPILSNENNHINDANVIIYENDSVKENLKFIGNGGYISSFNPFINKQYKIVAKVKGYGSASGFDTIPQKIPILKAILEIGKTFDEYGDPHLDFTVGFSDLPNIDNYYELILLNQQFINDKTYINIFNDVEDVDPVINSEGYIEFYPLTFIFSDKLFDGKYYELKMKMLFIANSGEFRNRLINGGNGYYIVLRSVSKTYYEYRKAWVRHKYNQQTGNKIEEPLFMVLIGDPVPMFTNIQNGFGIFASYTQDYKECNIIKYNDINYQ